LCNIVLLKQTDGGNAAGSGTYALRGIFSSYTAERQHRNGSGGHIGSPAGLPQEFQAAGVFPPILFEHRREYGKVRAMGLGHCHFLDRVAGNAYRGTCLARLHEQDTGFAGLNIIGRQMHAVSAACQRDIDPRVDEQFGLRSAGQRRNSAVRKLLQFADAEVFFAELNIVDAGRRALCDFFQQPQLLLSAGPGKLCAICDVAE